ncbi:MAG: topoisomerase C-terminal repeat-containing protein, partial [Clostridia bacterium]|nr:topoisomerase C-terminal repeat-containing protein [Clostridia bacterium]
IRGRVGYGCMGYKDGCEFRINLTICKKTLPIHEVRRMLATGKTAKMNGFVSKTGKIFSAALTVKDGKVVFDFSER